MGAELISNSNMAAAIIADLETSLAQLPESDRPKWSLREELLADASLSRLQEATIAQPLCTAIQIVLISLLRSAGVEFAVVVGHSSGEIAAAYASGYISAHNAIRIAYYRGYHSRKAGAYGRKGSMMAGGTSLEDAQELCDLDYFKGRLVVAASNSSSSVTFSGDEDAIAEAEVIFGDERKFARKLLVDKAYHSHHMLPCSSDYIKSMVACAVDVQGDKNRGCIWFSSVHGQEISPTRDDLACTYWNDNMVKPVLFSQAIEKAYTENGSYDIAIEIGPHPALKGPAIQVISESSKADEVPPYIGFLHRGKNDVEAFADGLGRLWALFGDSVVDFTSYDKAVFSGAKARLLKDLPPYPWDHDRKFWHESRLSRAVRTRTEPVHQLLGHRCPDGTDQQISWRNYLQVKEVPWIQDHQLQVCS